MQVEIISPDLTLYSGEATLVQLPGIDGSFEIMSHHAPLISVLKAGKIKVMENKEARFFDVNGGVVEVLGNKILILAE